MTEVDLGRPSRFSRRFLERELELALSSALAFCHTQGIKSDYSEESLIAFEALLPRNPEEYLRVVSNFDKFKYDGSYLSDWLVALGPGSYFGEVILRILGGRWKYPSRLRVFLSLYTSYSSPIFLNWFVIVGKQKVPVFEIARQRMILGTEGESFTQIYRKISKGKYARRPSRISHR